MARLNEVDYPLRLCVELLRYAGLGADGKTDNMNASEIRKAVGVFFTNEHIDNAIKYLTTGKL